MAARRIGILGWSTLTIGLLAFGCSSSETTSGSGASGGVGGSGAAGGGVVTDADNDGYDSSVDCDDSNPDVHPGAEEVCNGIDDNCVDGIDENGNDTYYVDGDNDSYGVDDPATNIEGCGLPAGYAAEAGDCDDDDPDVHPGAVDVPGNGIDEDCAGGDTPCVIGAIDCEGTVMTVCDANGLWSGAQDCAPDECVPSLGCVVCQPGESTCNGNVAHTCLNDGSGFIDIECDPLQGSTCDPNTGMCTGSCAPQVLGRSYIGCDFYPTVTQQHDGYNTAPSNVYAVAVSNTTANDANVTVTQGASTITTTTVAPNSLEIIVLPWVNALTKGSGPSVLVADGAYRLRTDQPVTVYQYNPIDSTTTNDASLLFPTNAWTGSYVVASWPHWTGAFNLPGFYAVTAREDGTTVTLSPSATGGQVQAGGGVAANGTGTVSLDAGDVLQVVTAAGDLTGTAVSADKPVQVIGGHQCTNVPSNVTACDHLEESMFPVETLLDEYVVAPPIQTPNDTLEKGQIVRVIATEDATTLSFDPNQPANTFLANAGDFVELATTVERFVVSADKKILVSQYMVGQSAGYGASDPAMVLAVSPIQWRDNYLVHAPISWTANYVDLIALTGTQVSVDGTNVGTWWPVGATGYSVAHVQLLDATGGNHTIQANDGVSVSVYGLQTYGSYWYPGGLDLRDAGIP